MLILFSEINANPLETQLYSCCLRRIIQCVPNEFQLIFNAEIQSNTCHINSGHSNIKIYANLKYHQIRYHVASFRSLFVRKTQIMGFFQQASVRLFLILKCL